MLNVSKKIVLQCDAFLCGWEQAYSEEEFNEIMTFDEEQMSESDKFLASGNNIFSKLLKEKIFIQQGRCPACEARATEPKQEFKGGLLRQPIRRSFPRRVE
jgi:hypothetical protein